FLPLLKCQSEAGEWKQVVKDKLSWYVENLKEGRVVISLDGMPLLFTIRADLKEILVCTLKASRELCLIKWFDMEREELKAYSQDIELLRFHIEKIAELSPQKIPSKIEEITFQKNLPDFLQELSFEDVDQKALELTRQIEQKISNYKPSLFEKFSDYALKLTAQYDLYRVHLLKFLAILPSLDHDKGSEVKRIFLETLRRLDLDAKLAKIKGKKEEQASIPFLHRLFLKKIYWVTTLFPAHLLATLVRATVKLMARRFIAGENIEEAKVSLAELARSGREATLDQLGELVISHSEAEHYTQEVLKIIEGLGSHIQRGDKNKAGILKAHVSIKVSAMGADFKPYAFDYTYEQIAPRLRKVLMKAKEHCVFVNIDAEHYCYRDIVFEIYQKILLETPELRDFPHTGIVVQAYLQDAYEHLKQVISLAERRKMIMPIRLVKGAYWDAETIEAKAHNFIAPQFLNKEETDLHFRQLICVILQKSNTLQLCMGSHNVYDHAWAEELRNLRYPQAAPIEHQCLHMTYEALSHALQEMNLSTRNYIPIGGLLVGMAYLVRRIMENSSQVGILAQSRSKRKKEVLNPVMIHKTKKIKSELVFDAQFVEMSAEFENVAPVRLYLLDERQNFLNQLKNFEEKRLGKEYENVFPLTGELLEVFSPSTLQKVGSLRKASKEDVQEAVEKITKAYLQHPWRQDFFLRAGALLKAAGLFHQHRFSLASLIVHEAGKNVGEALADVDEAIDFLAYYARQEVQLKKNYTKLESRGVEVVIAPWNFPLAIPCGMVAAALVAGNAVLIKSSEQTPLIVEEMVRLLHASGVPVDILIHLPGKGSEIGKILTSHPNVHGYIFTGSKQVGLSIAEEAGKKLRHKLQDNELTLVKAITEMGGKNAVIVTSSAELDETVAGILYSAFGHAGQKCSATSRVIVHSSIKKRFLERFVQATYDLKVGTAFDLSTSVNPVISAKEKKRLQDETTEAILEADACGGTVLLNRVFEALPGNAIGPALFELPAKEFLNPNSFSQKELFGPIVHFTSFDTLDEAIQLFNATEYALTGGIYCQSQDDIDKLLANLKAGNLYVNRPNTGARVAIEPFGGFKMSGTGPKAGGAHYLLSIHKQSSYHVSFQKHFPSERIEGDENSFEFPVKNFQTVKEIRETVKKGIKNIYKNYSLIFQNSQATELGLSKEDLEDFRLWIKKNIISFCTEKHWNHKIPGQMSYNSYAMAKDWGCLFAYHHIPAASNVFHALSVLALGGTLSVVCRNEKSFVTWKKIAKCLYEGGVPVTHLQVLHPSIEGLTKILKRKELSFAILDGSPQDIAEILPVLFDRNIIRESIPSLHTHMEGPRIGEWQDFLLGFILMRSMAINTMRHGAPLNTSIEVSLS
ncbi:MAG: proline dehydrogenase family protein, partial [Bacteriovoracaceae bacterium]|nr:proline dehydrogenase family protein [Bacteriovoracaceae bacterium]